MARKILLADDSVTAQNMGRRILTDAGYEVTTVNNGSAALKKVADFKPDLIVLDVYMPGYGGLEVCQRLRESDDTARIPVLLTVGKLEPFKVDEVRRVRADAYIVKPFEASELLTALTKLEDKIVPQAQPRKPGRFPKPGETLDDFVPSGKQFGDTETGWKNRLRIPPPHHKSQPEFPDPEPDRTPRQSESPRREEAKKEPVQPVAVEKEISAKQAPANSHTGLPPDITPEEIAAIQAAAAAFSSPKELATEPVKPEAASRKEISQVSSLSEVSASPADAPQAEVKEVATASETPATIAESLIAAETAPIPSAEHAVTKPGKLAEHEVAAVLASLQAVTGADAMQDDEPLFATMAASVHQEFSGPRWVATPVHSTEEESSLVLEQEMQKAMATLAAMNETQPDASPAISESISVGQALTEIVESQADETPAATVAGPIEEQSTSPQVAEAVASIVEPPPVETTALQPEAAYAAAASTGVAVGETMVSIEAATAAPAPAEVPPTATVEPERESELAAAWASWKQIRESVVTPQMASQIAEVAAAASSSPETAVTETAAEDATADSPDESEAIAGIVDTVLAELKPKLMQEIAKKMAKSKKK